MYPEFFVLKESHPSNLGGVHGLLLWQRIDPHLEVERSGSFNEGVPYVEKKGSTLLGYHGNISTGVDEPHPAQGLINHQKVGHTLK